MLFRSLRTAGRVLANPRFLALFISQVLTQVGGNMVLFALTIKVFDLTGATTSVSVLLLTFLVPAVIFGAVAGVFVDRYDRRAILVGTNLARGLLFLPLVFLDDQLAIIYVATALVATLTTFFSPAESAMIPLVVPRSQLLSANGLFIFGLQASFALGFAVLGPLLNSALGTEPLILIVAVCYIAAGLVLAWTTGSLRILLLAGFCGAFTTFSGFGWEAHRLWDASRRAFWAAVVVMPVACVAGFLIAWKLAGLSG